MFSLELPHQGNSNEYTQYTIFNMKKKITLNCPKSAAAMGFFPVDEFEMVINKPSVFEPPKVYCSYLLDIFTEKPYCKPLQCSLVYFPLFTLSHATCTSHDFT